MNPYNSINGDQTNKLDRLLSTKYKELMKAIPNIRKYEHAFFNVLDSAISLDIAFEAALHRFNNFNEGNMVSIEDGLDYISSIKEKLNKIYIIAILTDSMGLSEYKDQIIENVINQQFPTNSSANKNNNKKQTQTQTQQPPYQPKPIKNKSKAET